MLKIDNNEIKLVVCDIDGTVARNNSEGHRIVSTEVINTINSLRDNQVYFVFNTGNSYITVGHISNQFNASDSKYTKYLIAINGNCIYDFKERKSYIKKLIPKNLVVEIQSELEKFGISIMAMNETADRIYISNVNDKEKFKKMLEDEGENSIALLKSPADFTDSAQVSIELTNPQFKGEAEFVLQKHVSNIDVTWWSKYGLDLGVKGVNKFSGLLDIIDIINDNEGENITVENVIYFGDQNNDLSVFENHKYSIAMGNAIEEVKDRAFDITDTVMDNGFPNYIKKITK